ncbi:type II toxin-antitoxin system PemK/MazF family toxin [Paenibacillus cellulositrophicus]|uniref:type II toxin-antitoxin system PemK/MazF family toxin n=1 Tax=Paenibacillus cellulositrophicus TaxID=562959 RepID=UPI003F7E4172
MFPIDKRTIKRDVDALGASQKKRIKGLTVSTLADSYKNSTWNMMDTIHDSDAYTMLNWVLHIDRWINNIGKEYKTKYNRGEIVFVEWGAMNFGYEPSYEHPGVIIANAYNTVLIAPCSSQTYGKSINGIIDLPITDATGLTDNSGVAANAVRWISKNRILNRLGIVSNKIILDQVEDYILKKVFYSNVNEGYYMNEIFDLKKEKAVLEIDLENTKEQLGKTKNHLSEMKDETRLLLDDIENLLKSKAPGILEAYKEVAGARQKILD